MTTCPTPTKTRYATQNAALNAAARATLRLDTPLRPYECPCTWWHLTKQAITRTPNPSEATKVAIERLVSIPDIDFREIVASDIRSQGPIDERAALRHHRNLPRWKRHLGQLINDVEKQLQERRKDQSLEGHDWRKRATEHRDSIAVRITECRRLRAEAHVELMKRDDSRRRDAETAAQHGATAKELRAHAGELAVDRLINAHRDEFNGYLVEEYRAFGLEIPDRFTKWTRHTPNTDQEESTR